jgi:hypothetical protein
VENLEAERGNGKAQWVRSWHNYESYATVVVIVTPSATLPRETFTHANHGSLKVLIVRSRDFSTARECGKTPLLRRENFGSGDAESWCINYYDLHAIKTENFGFNNSALRVSTARKKKSLTQPLSPSRLNKCVRAAATANYLSDKERDVFMGLRDSERHAANQKHSIKQLQFTLPSADAIFFSFALSGREAQ